MGYISKKVAAYGQFVLVYYGSGSNIGKSEDPDPEMICSTSH